MQPPLAQGGMLYAVLLPAVAMGLAFGLAVFPIHALRHRRASRAAKLAGGEHDEREWVRPYSQTAALLDAACTVDKNTVCHGDSYLDILPGRPDVEALLAAAAKEAGQGGVVGVYVGGPMSMNTSVHLAVARLNSAAELSGPYLELHRETVQL